MKERRAGIAQSVRKRVCGGRVTVCLCANAAYNCRAGGAAGRRPERCEPCARGSAVSFRRCPFGGVVCRVLTCRVWCPCAFQMFSVLYGQTAAALYAKAAGQNAQARQLYNASADTYYKANDAAAYDDWVRARNHWDYFYNRS